MALIKTENIQKGNLNQLVTVRTAHKCMHITVPTGVHNTAQNTCDNLPSYLPDNHHSSGVYQRGREPNTMKADKHQ